MLLSVGDGLHSFPLGHVLHLCSPNRCRSTNLYMLAVLTILCYRTAAFSAKGRFESTKFSRWRFRKSFSENENSEDRSIASNCLKGVVSENLVLSNRYVFRK